MSYADSLRQLREIDAREHAAKQAALAASIERAATQRRRDALYVEDQQRRYALRVAAGLIQEDEE